MKAKRKTEQERNGYNFTCKRLGKGGGKNMAHGTVLIGTLQSTIVIQDTRQETRTMPNTMRAQLPTWQMPRTLLAPHIAPPPFPSVVSGGLGGDDLDNLIC